MHALMGQDAGNLTADVPYSSSAAIFKRTLRPVSEALWSINSNVYPAAVAAASHRQQIGYRNGKEAASHGDPARHASILQKDAVLMNITWLCLNLPSQLDKRPADVLKA